MIQTQWNHGLTDSNNDTDDDSDTDPYIDTKIKKTIPLPIMTLKPLMIALMALMKMIPKMTLIPVRSPKYNTNTNIDTYTNNNNH